MGLTRRVPVHGGNVANAAADSAVTADELKWIVRARDAWMQWIPAAPGGIAHVGTSGEMAE